MKPISDIVFTKTSDQTEQTDRSEQMVNNKTNRTDRADFKNLIDKLPFTVNRDFAPAIIRHAQRMGLKKFNEVVEAARGARTPERYLMKCLVNSERLNRWQ